MSTRDITQSRFDKVIAQYGIKPSFLGSTFYELPLGRHTTVLNSGSTKRRTQLAWLLKQMRDEPEKDRKAAEYFAQKRAEKSTAGAKP